MLKLLLNFAVDGLRRTPPPHGHAESRRVARRTDEEYKPFEARWAPGTKERRAYVFSLYGGQRLTDLVAMAHASQERNIRVAQSKTAEELWILAHRELTAELGRDVIGHMSLLTTTQGKGFDRSIWGRGPATFP